MTTLTGMSRILALLLMCLVVTWPYTLGAATGRIETRPGVTVRVDTFIPDNPVASVLLLRGVFGNIVDYKYYPLSAIYQLQRAGIAVAVMGLPSDRKFLSVAYRLSEQHQIDLVKTMAYLRKLSGRRVWAFGSSTGSVSAATAGIIGGPDLAGVVLMSSLTAIETAHTNDKRARALLSGPGRPKNVQDLPLGKIRAPALVVRHEKDRCKATPPDGGPKILSGLTASVKAEMLSFSGGSHETGDVCDTKTFHLFHGITATVTGAIIEFIKANSGFEPQARKTAIGAVKPGRPQGGKPGTDGRPDPSQIIGKMDRDKDGKVSKDEFKGPPKKFGKLDMDRDGFLTIAEFEEAAAKRKSGGGNSGGSRNNKRLGEEGSPLTREQIQKYIIGNTLSFSAPKSGKILHVYFASEGRVFMQSGGATKVTSHKWFINDKALLCRTLGPKNKKKQCTRIKPDGTDSGYLLFNRKVQFQAKLATGRALPE